MDKIIVAINKMIENKSLISDVHSGISDNEELFFKFKKYVWGISRDEFNNTFILYYYPSQEKVKDLASLPDRAFQNINYVTYKSKDFDSIESIESFNELFNAVSSKLFNIDSVLDDIIED